MNILARIKYFRRRTSHSSDVSLVMRKDTLQNIVPRRKERRKDDILKTHEDEDDALWINLLSISILHKKGRGHE